MRPGAVNFCKMCGKMRSIFAKCAVIMRRFLCKLCGNCAAGISVFWVSVIPIKKKLKIFIFERGALSNTVL